MRKELRRKEQTWFTALWNDKKTPKKMEINWGHADFWKNKNNNVQVETYLRTIISRQKRKTLTRFRCGYLHCRQKLARAANTPHLFIQEFAHSVIIVKVSYIFKLSVMKVWNFVYSTNSILQWQNMYKWQAHINPKLHVF